MVCICEIDRSSLGDAVTGSLQRWVAQVRQKLTFCSRTSRKREEVGFFRLFGSQVDRGLDSFTVWLPVLPGFIPLVRVEGAENKEKSQRCSGQARHSPVHKASSLP